MQLVRSTSEVDMSTESSMIGDEADERKVQ